MLSTGGDFLSKDVHSILSTRRNLFKLYRSMQGWSNIQLKRKRRMMFEEAAKIGRCKLMLLYEYLNRTMRQAVLF